MTAFRELLRIDSNTTITEQHIASVEAEWDVKVSNDYRATPNRPYQGNADVRNFYHHADLLQQEIRENLAKWISETGQPDSQQAVERLSAVLVKYDFLFLWHVLSELLEEVRKLYNIQPNDHLAYKILVSAIGLCCPDLAFRDTSNWYHEENVDRLYDTPPIQICVSWNQATFLLEPLLETPKAQHALRIFSNARQPDKLVLFKAIQARNLVAVEILIKNGDDLVKNQAILRQLSVGTSETDKSDPRFMAIAKMIVKRYPELKRSLFPLALKEKDVELLKLYYSYEALAVNGPVDYLRQLIQYTALTDDELFKLPGITEACLQSAKRDELIHLSVECRRPRLTNALATKTRGAYKKAETRVSESEPVQRYALWYNNHPTSNKLDAAWDPIRQAIKGQIIKSCEPEKIEEIVRECDDEIYEYSLDFSRFDTHAFQLENFLKGFMSLEHKETSLHRNLRFEHTLKYVQFPHLSSEPVDGKLDHSEVRNVLEWLWREKGVSEIARLTVLDRLWGHHSESCIAEIAASFKIEILNWRCPDMSFIWLTQPVTTFSDQRCHIADGQQNVRLINGSTKRCPADFLKEIHLYSSGKAAIHQYWLGSEGLLKFKHLTKVYIHIIEDFLPKEFVIETVKNLKSMQAAFKEKWVNMNNSAITMHVDRYRSPTPRKTARGDSLQEITRQAFPELRNFLDRYRRLAPRKRTKVAIIDNGFMAASRTLGDAEAIKRDAQEQLANGTGIDPPENWSTVNQIFCGKSFVNVSSQKSTWFLAADPHGSQMTAIVCALDPNCEILVAQVGEYASDIYPARVAQAIHWAIKQGADVISMSFICKESPEMTGAILEAQKQNIIQFASCHDEGANQAEAHPAKYDATLAIAASGLYGDLVIPMQAHAYRFRGKDVFVGRVAHIKSVERLTGSSVATATASGLASLIISCMRMCDKSNGISDQDPNSIADAERAGQNEKAAGIRMNNNDGDSDSGRIVLPPNKENTGWRQKLVEGFFGLMSGEKGNEQYVLLKKFCDLHEISDLDEKDIMEDVIRPWICKHYPDFKRRI